MKQTLYLARKQINDGIVLCVMNHCLMAPSLPLVSGMAHFRYGTKEPHHLTGEKKLVVQRHDYIGV